MFALTQNIYTCIKYWRLLKNVGGLPNIGGKCMRQMYAANICGKCLRQMLAANVSEFPKYMQQMLAAKLCGIFVKLLCHIIYDRKKADIEISAPIKIYAPKLCVHLKIGAQTLRLLTIWARQNLQLLTSSNSN